MSADLMTAAKFKVGDKIFGKMKGYPAWPATVEEVILGKIIKYNMRFYGSRETTILAEEFVYDFAEHRKSLNMKSLKKSLRAAVEEADTLPAALLPDVVGEQEEPSEEAEESSDEADESDTSESLSYEPKISYRKKSQPKLQFKKVKKRELEFDVSTPEGQENRFQCKLCMALLNVDVENVMKPNALENSDVFKIVHELTEVMPSAYNCTDAETLFILQCVLRLPSIPFQRFLCILKRIMTEGNFAFETFEQILRAEWNEAEEEEETSEPVMNLEIKEEHNNDFVTGSEDPEPAVEIEPKQEVETEASRSRNAVEMKNGIVENDSNFLSSSAPIKTEDSLDVEMKDGKDTGNVAAGGVNNLKKRGSMD